MELKKTIMAFFDKSIELSKKSFDKAKEAGTLGIKTIEIKTLENQIAKKVAELGTIAFNHFSNKKTPLEKDVKEVSEVLDEISKLEKKIKEIEKEIKDLK